MEGLKKEELNNDIPDNQEFNKAQVMISFVERKESPMLTKVRQNFGIFGGISFIFGLIFVLLFYKAGFGLNNLVFTVVMITLLMNINKKLSLEIKTETYFYYTGAVLLALSSTLTANENIHFLNTIGILLLLDLSMLHQFYEVHRWDFMKHFLRMMGLPFQCIASIAMPFVDGINFMKHTKVFKNDKLRNVFLGVMISLPFLGIVTALLASADLLFGKLTRGAFNVIFSTDIFSIIFMLLFGFLACYCIICASVSEVGKEDRKPFRKADSSIAITFMTVLCLVYAVFCFIQVAYLFADGLFILPEEFTYAEYARRGFFELLAVAIMNVSLILICKALFQESKILRMIVTIITICTYIMIASATYRMFLYISVYHLTFLRLFVLLSLLIIALVLGGVIVTEYKNQFPLFRYCVAVASICYIIFSFAKPDYFIANYLIHYEEQLDQEDIAYLTFDLSIDAAPVVLPLLADNRRYSLDNTTEEDNYDREYALSESASGYLIADYYLKIKTAYSNQEIRDFNYSNYLAYQYAEKYPLEN